MIAKAFQNLVGMDDSSNCSCFDRPFVLTKHNKSFLEVLEASEEMVIFSDSGEEVASVCTTGTQYCRGFPSGLDFGVEAKRRKEIARQQAQEQEEATRQQLQQMEQEVVQTMTPTEYEEIAVVEEEQEPDLIMDGLAMATVAAHRDPDASAVIHDEGDAAAPAEDNWHVISLI